MVRPAPPHTGASIDFEHTSATYNHDKARSYWNWIRLWNYAQPPDVILEVGDNGRGAGVWQGNSWRQVLAAEVGGGSKGAGLEAEADDRDGAKTGWEQSTRWGLKSQGIIKTDNGPQGAVAGLGHRDPSQP
jgi:hypothetical protein